MYEETIRNGISGYVALPFMVALQVLFPLIFVVGLDGSVAMIVIGALGTMLVIACWPLAFFLVHPNEAKVLQLFGRYVGTAKESGLRFANPFYSKRVISLRIRNFESGKLKVNEAGGSPIEIATIVVWQVVETAEAAFEVDNFEEFVTIQSEAALRSLATSFPYESDDENQLSLRSNPKESSEALRKEIQARVDTAGVHVIEARISHLAYAPEIAGAMLRRQQAAAIIAARKLIVQGAVGIVHMALDGLQRESVLELDEERKAAMVGNLLVVLCGEQPAQPIVNAGSLYT